MLHKSKTNNYILLFPDLKPDNIAKDDDTLVLFDLDAAPMQDPDEISLNINTLIAKWELDAPTTTALHDLTAKFQTAINKELLKNAHNQQTHAKTSQDAPHYQSRLTSPTSLDLDTLRGQPSDSLHSLKQPSPPLTIDRLGGLKRQRLESTPRSGIKKIAVDPYSQPLLRNT